MSKLLNRLTQFYRNEKCHIPHDKTALFDLAWDLADILEDYGPDSNIFKGDDEDFQALVYRLRHKYDVIAIDTAVNHMHQSLLDSQWEDCGPMLGYCDGDVVEFLLHRNDNDFEEKVQKWEAEEEAAEIAARLAEEEYWQKLEEIENEVENARF